MIVSISLASKFDLTQDFKIGNYKVLNLSIFHYKNLSIAGQQLSNFIYFGIWLARVF